MSEFKNQVPEFLSDEESEETNNGLILQNVYIPEETLLHILSYVEPRNLLKYSLVCRKWNKLIKSYALWSTIYRRKYNQKPKHLPWYLYCCLLTTNYFDHNHIQNGNGQDNYQHWKIKANGGDKFTIEDPPIGADPLPLDVPEFHNKTSCFATSFGNCHKVQLIKLGKNGLFRHILDNYKPHIYLSEWIAGRFDCGSVYVLRLNLRGSNMKPKLREKPCAMQQFVQWQARKWEKIEMTVTNYPDGVEELLFEHIGRDNQFWAGHYGSKMAGGVLKLLWDSVEPLTVDDDGNIKPKIFTELQYVSNGLSAERRQQLHGLWNIEPYPAYNLDDEDELEIYGDGDIDDDNDEW